MRRGSGEPSRTLLICDFPDDTSPEEVVAYFERIAPAGFVSARLRKDRNQQQIGFVDYDGVELATKAHDAVAACGEELRGAKIAIYYARNSTSNPNAGPAFASPPGSNKRPFEPSGGEEYRRQPPSSPSVPRGHGGQGSAPFHAGSEHGGDSFARARDEPSNTLFVDNVPADATLREVGHIFRQFPGFKSLRMKAPPREGGRTGPICFVEFDAPHFAVVALRAVQNYRFDWRPEFENSSPRLRLEFAKAPRS